MVTSVISVTLWWPSWHDVSPWSHLHMHYCVCYIVPTHLSMVEIIPRSSSHQIPNTFDPIAKVTLWLNRQLWLSLRVPPFGVHPIWGCKLTPNNTPSMTLTTADRWPKILCSHPPKDQQSLLKWSTSSPGILAYSDEGTISIHYIKSMTMIHPISKHYIFAG